MFLRFAECNLWKDGSRPSAICPFCDTPQLHNATVRELEHIVSALTDLQEGCGRMGLVITGGEPLLQLDDALLSVLAPRFEWVDIETNGTVVANFALPANVLISCSPKTAQIVLTKVHQFKVLIPDKARLLSLVEELAERDSAAIFVQPTEVGGYDSIKTQANMRAALHHCFTRGYRISAQLHKLLGVR